VATLSDDTLERENLDQENTYERLVIVSCGDGHFRQVENEISNLSEELVLVDIPFRTRAPRNIHIRIDECDSLEVFAALNGWRTESIADKLRVV
jgi:hypothetical protein